MLPGESRRPIYLLYFYFFEKSDMSIFESHHHTPPRPAGLPLLGKDLLSEQAFLGELICFFVVLVIGQTIIAANLLLDDSGFVMHDRDGVEHSSGAIQCSCNKNPAGTFFILVSSLLRGFLFAYTRHIFPSLCSLFAPEPAVDFPIVIISELDAIDFGQHDVCIVGILVSVPLMAIAAPKEVCVDSSIAVWSIHEDVVCIGFEVAACDYGLGAAEKLYAVTLV